MTLRYHLSPSFTCNLPHIRVGEPKPRKLPCCLFHSHLGQSVRYNHQHCTLNPQGKHTCWRLTKTVKKGNAFCQTFRHRVHHCFRFVWRATTLIAVATSTGTDRSGKDENGIGIDYIGMLEALCRLFVH